MQNYWFIKIVIWQCVIRNWYKNNTILHICQLAKHPARRLVNWLCLRAPSLDTSAAFLSVGLCIFNTYFRYFKGRLRARLIFIARAVLVYTRFSPRFSTLLYPTILPTARERSGEVKTPCIETLSFIVYEQLLWKWFGYS